MNRSLFTVAASTLLLVASAVSFGQEVSSPGTDPGAMTVARFAEPPETVRPWVYYWQLKGNTSKELITRDLENMAQIGVGGLLVFDSRRYWDDYASTTHVPVPLEIQNEFMSDGWIDNMSWLVSEAARLGLQVSFNISDSGGQLRGPWDMKELGPYELVWTEANLNGPKQATLDFSTPEDKPYYRDLAAFAVRITSDVAEGREAVRLNDAWNQVRYPGADSPRYADAIDLTSKIADGKLTVDLPDGHWKVLRFGATRIGEPGCVDILNAKSVENYFHKMPGRLLDAVGENAGKTLSHFYNVSWEGVHPNWSDGFAEFFAERRRYAIEPNLPILCGFVPEEQGQEYADRFVADYKKTISDAFCANCYETVGRLCHERGVRWHSEDGGPWNRQSPLFAEADMLSFWGQNDFPQGEFWIGNLARTNAPFAAMASHIYGRRDVSLEAFTHMTKHWSVYPAMLKPYADVSFLAGANFMIWHTYTASPKELGKPGFEYFAGTHVNSNVTWQPYVRPFMRYMTRCQLLLRQGKFRADVCVYASDKNYTDWGNGEKWNATTKLTLPRGYRYDLLDTKVLLERLTYEDGVFKLPGGAEYKLLVLDPSSEDVPVDVLRKIERLAASGAPILLGPTKSRRSVALTDYPNADETAREIADRLWNAASDYARVYRDQDVVDALTALGVKPDFESEAPFQFARRTVDDKELYFVSAPGKGACRGLCSFRVANKKATLWNATDGSVVEVPCEPTADGRTSVAIDLPENGSVFVVFSDEPIEGAKPLETPTRSTLFELTQPWNVAFDPEYGGPEKTTFEKLSYWNENAEPGIKYYSGVATYSTEFELTDEQASKRLVLDLGVVRDVARVKLNGRDLGIAWIAPWEVALNDAARSGKNVLEIEVANCWRNRLIGDAGLPPSERFTRTNVVLEKEAEKMPPYRGYVSTDELEPSGLIGPVKLEELQ